MSNYPIKERNEMLICFFEGLGYEVKLLGDRNQPKVIITIGSKSFVVSGYVKNKLYNFTTEPFGGTEVLTINLNDTSNIKREDIDNIFKNNKQRNYFTIRLKGSDIYYLKTEDNNILFSSTDKRYFFDKEKAQSTLDYLAKYNNNVELVKNI